MVNSADEALYESLSAVMDGQGTAADWQRVNAAWAGDPGLRERWASWHAAADGLRSAELPTRHRDAQTLLDALHAQMPPRAAAPVRGRDWLAPLAVAASFVALALGLGLLRPAQSPERVIAAAPVAVPGPLGLTGLSFAQTAAGHSLPAASVAREAGLPADSAPALMDWGLPLPEAASRPVP